MDTGEKFLRKELNNLFTNSGIMPEFSLPYSLESNWREKNLNRILLFKARAMLHPLGTEFQNLWAEEVAAARYIENLMFSMGCQMAAITPIETMKSIKPDVSNLKQFS